MTKQEFLEQWIQDDLKHQLDVALAKKELNTALTNLFKVLTPECDCYVPRDERQERVMYWVDEMLNAINLKEFEDKINRQREKDLVETRTI